MKEEKLISKEQCEFLQALESGNIRAAIQNTDGQWQVNPAVKEGILSLFKTSQNIEIDQWPGYIDREILMPRTFFLDQGVRVVPGGSSVRAGAYIAPGVVMMPPSYVNIGAYVGAGTMIDSHVLVGSCAQIGKNIHLSAAVQIGGVLEPVLAQPVILEDNVFVGAGSKILEGICVREGAIIAPGVTLSKSVEVIDLVTERYLEAGQDIPSNAVVIPGTKPVSSEWGRAEALQKSCALIVKYRDGTSSAATELEFALRP